MINFEVGLIVEHTALPELGRARVEDVVGENVHLLFEKASGEMKVFKVANESLVRSKDQGPQGFPQRKPNALVTGKKRASKAKSPAKTANAWGFDEAWTRFITKFPAGFNDSKFLEKERAEKVAAGARWKQEFGTEGLAKLKAANDPVAVDAAFGKVYQGLNLLHVIEWLKFRESLKASPASLALAELYAEVAAAGTISEDAFGRLLKAFDSLGLGGGKWTLLTLWPYLASSKGAVFMKPTLTKAAAEGMGIALGYEAKPSYATYAKAISLYEELWTRLEPQGARDWIDVQSFLWTGWA